MKFQPASLATLARLLRRDGFAFFGKCARYAFSRDAWLWLLRGGRHAIEPSPAEAVRATARAPVKDFPPAERERSRRALRDYAPKISVVVTSYNYAHVLRETLDALVAQTRPAHEILVVDNGSTDDSVAIVREYAAKWPVVRLLQHEGGVNKGLPASVKLGSETATGEFVAFCEADDLWTPDHLEKKVEFLRERWGEPNFVINDFEPFGDPARCGQIEEAMKLRLPALAETRNRVPPVAFRVRNYVFTFSICMVRRSVLLGCDMLSVPFPSNLDWWLWRQICFDNDIWCVHEKLTRWRQHGDSYLMREKRMDRWADQQELTSRMDAFLCRKHPALADSLRPFLRPEDRMSCEGGRMSIEGAETEQPSFSVVMAETGRADLDDATLESAALQSYGNFELVLVSSRGNSSPCGGRRDWSADGRLAGKIRRIAASEGSGADAALEAGVAAAGSDWVVPVFPGDILRADALKTFAARIVLRPEANGVCGIARTLSGGRNFGGPSQTAPGTPTGPFACVGAFAFRRSAPSARHGFSCVEARLAARALSAPPTVFASHIVLLRDDGPNGRDPGAKGLFAAIAEFLAARPVGRREPSKAELDAIRRSPFFDHAWYLRNNPDVRQAGVDPVVHYFHHGRETLRNPGPDFVGVEYLALNRDVRDAGENPLVHFECRGRKENRPPSFLHVRPSVPPGSSKGTGEAFPAPPLDCGLLRRLREEHPSSFPAKIDAIRRERTGRGLPVRALFLVSSASMFPARPLFDAMLRDPGFDARIFVVPDLRWWDRDPEPLRRTCRENLGAGYPDDRFLEAQPDADGVWPDVIGDFGADVVCYSSPYDFSFFRYNPHWAVGRGFLPIYISYSFSTSIHGYEVYGRQNYAYFWKVFVECEANAKEYAEHSILKGANAELTGYFKMDALATAKPWARNGGRKRVLIAPHHSVQGGANDSLALSNFQRYADYFLALPEKHPELDFVFRPHPFLFTVLSHPSKWGQEKVADWIARMKAHPNVRWSDEGDYFPAFASCDAIIQDCGSFLAEWVYTGKPCCFMLKTPSDVDAKFTPLGRDILSHCYLAYDEPAIESFLRDVVEGGTDPKAAARDKFRKSIMVNYPHAAEAALASIKKALGMS